jgi:large subunit ribosomal protein L18
MTIIKRNKTLAQMRKLRVRGKLFGTASRPRLTVFRSNEHLSLQAIDDQANKTLLGLSDVSKKVTHQGTKTERAVKLTQDFVKKLQKLEIKALVFDRGSYKYHGRVKAVAEALREAGIKV